MSEFVAAATATAGSLCHHALKHRLPLATALATGSATANSDMVVDWYIYASLTITMLWNWHCIDFPDAECRKCCFTWVLVMGPINRRNYDNIKTCKLLHNNSYGLIPQRCVCLSIQSCCFSVYKVNLIIDMLVWKALCWMKFFWLWFYKTIWVSTSWSIWCKKYAPV